MIEDLVQHFERLILEDSRMASLCPLADYDKVGLYDGKKPASCWLARLAHERRRVGGGGTPEDFFEAVEILFEDEAASWLDSSLRYKRMMDHCDKATQGDVEELTKALQSQFRANVPSARDEGNLNAEIGSFEQGLQETLGSYCGRAQEIPRRSHGRDAPADGGFPLAPIEMVVLNNVVTAFLGGLRDDQVRSIVLMKSTAISGSLRRAYETVEDAKTTLEKIKEMERLREEKKRTRNV